MKDYYFHPCEFEKQEAEELRKWCYEKHGWTCDKCGSTTASTWCINHKDFNKEKEKVIH